MAIPAAESEFGIKLAREISGKVFMRINIVSHLGVTICQLEINN
jgi:hypothetical protein